LYLYSIIYVEEKELKTRKKNTNLFYVMLGTS
jgi:hypothetical protein